MKTPVLGRLTTASLLILALATGCASPQTASPDLDAECRVQPPTEPIACTMEWDPVCGCDGRTYGNACEARGAGVSAFERGACDEAASRR